MRKKVKGFDAITVGYGISILMSLYEYICKFADFSMKLVDDYRDSISYIMLFLFAYGFFRIGWTARTKGRIGAVIAGILNALLVADMLMEWGIGQYFSIAITLSLLIYLIWGQEKHVWVATAFMAVFAACYYLADYGLISALSSHTHLLSALMGIATVVAVSTVEEY